MRVQTIITTPAPGGSAPAVESVTVHTIGDLHISQWEGASYIAARMNAFRDDVMTMDEPDYRVAIGDITEFANSTEVGLANAMFDAIEAVVGPPIRKVAGNHDYHFSTGKGAAEFEAEYGGNPNWYVDVGSWLRLVGVSPTVLHNPNPGYIDLPYLLSATDTSRTCVVFCHYPIYGTVGQSSETSNHSEMEFYHAYTISGVNNALTSRPNIKAWVSGHTHSELTATDLLKQHPVGGRTVATISTSAIAHTPIRPVSLAMPLCSPVLEIYHDRIEATFRDHKTGGVAPVGGNDTNVLYFE